MKALFMSLSAGEPLRRGNHLVNVDAAVAVGIQQFERLGVELEPFHGAAEHRPFFAVQFAEVGYVGAAFKFHPDGPADRGILPVVVFFHMDFFN